MRLGVLGGTFDPPHLGHLVVATEARSQLALDRVLLVPAAVPPHKPGGPTFSPERRAALVERAIRGEPGLELSRIELERPGRSFTADTLEAVAAAHRGAELWFILGADQLATLPGWRDPERVLRLARLAVAPRAGRRPIDRAAVGQVAAGTATRADLGAEDEADRSIGRGAVGQSTGARDGCAASADADADADADAERRVDAILPGRVTWLDTPEIGISSSLVRARLAAGRPVRWLVPPAVEAALREDGLVPSDPRIP